ncbi:TonB-dependent receptor [Portibacter lacus]|uniref:TonB-dependent receptor n=1 Tax=Portibacter lacus TaxID=1099794 RepID=A0AA37SPK3_9BACT|nr:TonB-dependent receptor [Portibacter lacus]GLR18301.1 TonB-dependent receptor [Portibacter lacus]
MKKFFTLTIFALFAFAMNAQTVTGVIVDQETAEPLIGAVVQQKGTSNGTITDIDGSFTLALREGNPVLLLTFLGFNDSEIDLTGKTGSIDLGNVELSSNAMGLEEVTITGTMDIVKDRRTPVAVSTISVAEIQANSGNVEFPELMKNTPSIYVAGQSGGYGDSEIFTRGFDQTNTAFLLNGQPINGMEDGKMYWSNWSGMTDVATAVQIQRGLGSSKLAISSVGGTINIIMKATDIAKGGNASILYGNDNYLKATASYSSGMINDKFGVSFLLTHWQGDGWAEGTKGAGQNYFISAGYKINNRNKINFLITGAPQYHDQNFNKRISDHYNDPANPDEFNIKFNNNYGTLDGEYLSMRRNYYHKPVANLNWDLKFDNQSSLSTVAYASWGNGGGTGPYGDTRIDGYNTADGHIDFDNVIAANAQVDGGIGLNNVNRQYLGTAIRGSRNNHAWYGLVSNYSKKLNQNLNFSIGADLRTYHGSHYRELVDLLGLNGFDESDKARFNNHIVSETFPANPWTAMYKNASLAESIDYRNDETISYAGAFSQFEYTNSRISAFLQGAISNQSHVRFELHNNTEAEEKSENVNNLGYNVKGGASYSINTNNTIFFNTGFYQRQPFHDNIYLNFSNFVNPVAVPEKVFGIEAGYKFANQNFALNLNAYRTSWKDRATTRTLNDGDELPNGFIIISEGFRNTLQNQLHSGVELDFSYKINKMASVRGYTSIGDWAYQGSLNSQYFDVNRELVYQTDGDDVDGVRVGGAAQTTFGLGLDVKPIKPLFVSLKYNYYNNLYSNIGVGTTSLLLPDFGLLDLGVRYNVDLANGQLLTLRGNIYNLLGTEYISRATSSVEASSVESENWNGVNKSNFVQFGKTRTWNVSLKYSF